LDQEAQARREKNQEARRKKQDKKLKADLWYFLSHSATVY
jgi:hypothetical protein